MAYSTRQRRKMWALAPSVVVLLILAASPVPILHLMLPQAPFGNPALGWVCCIVASLAVSVFAYSAIILMLMGAQLAWRLDIFPYVSDWAVKLAAWAVAVSFLLGAASIGILFI